jgi:hypothetical protein
MRMTGRLLRKGLELPQPPAAASSGRGCRFRRLRVHEVGPIVSAPTHNHLAPRPRDLRRGRGDLPARHGWLIASRSSFTRPKRPYASQRHYLEGCVPCKRRISSLATQLERSVRRAGASRTSVGGGCRQVHDGRRVRGPSSSMRPSDTVSRGRTIPTGHTG